MNEDVEGGRPAWNFVQIKVLLYCFVYVAVIILSSNLDVCSLSSLSEESKMPLYPPTW